MQSPDFSHALAFIKSAHADQKRKDGRPYWTHPVAVREILANELNVSDRAANLAALLHDTVEDTPVTLDQITSEFGADVAAYVRFLTNKLPGETPEQAKDRYHAELRTAPDCVRCIKAADRIHNLREMKDTSAKFRRKYLPETKHLIEILDGCSAISALVAEFHRALASFGHECFDIAMPNKPEIKVLPDAAAIAREAAERIVKLSEEAIEARGRFSIALSGGSTPKALHNLLASPEFVTKLDWPAIDLFFGDERCVPPDHKDSNYKMALETLISKVPVPRDNVYRMRGEIPAEESAKEYGLMLKERFGENGLDVVLLGMGDDGHTLSIFPGAKAIHEKEHRVVGYFAKNSSTGESWRVTMTAPFVNKARNVIVMLAGANKAARLKQVLEGPKDPDRLPIQLIQPDNGKMTWLLDNGAAGM